MEGISHGGVGGWVEDDKRAVGMNRTRRESRIVKKKRKKKGMDPVEERGEGRVSSRRSKGRGIDGGEDDGGMEISSRLVVEVKLLLGRSWLGGFHSEQIDFPPNYI